jgi:acyl-homoserine-lactone acylase
MISFARLLFVSLLLSLTLSPGNAAAQRGPDAALLRQQKRAAAVTIIRDEWGVPHLYGKGDADVVFGLLYAQCEDNYWQLEESMIRLLGRAAELYGEGELSREAAVANWEVVAKAKKGYATAHPLVRRLCEAAADGVNYFLSRNPSVERRLLQRYEPWYFLLQGPGSGNGHGLTEADTRRLMSGAVQAPAEGWMEGMESGSNAVAIGRQKSASGNPLLLINPHVAFFGGGQRYEAHLVSEEGLNASGFAMFGQFWIWSGFTAATAWAHTNTASDYDDVYAERFTHPTDSTRYRYGQGYRQASFWYDTLRYRTPEGIKTRIYRFGKTHHGPLIARRDSLHYSMRRPENMAAYVLQAWQMSKARNLAAFRKALGAVQLSTNTMYADAVGNIAYWHGNAIPRRNTGFNFAEPVDGSNPLTEWQGMHALNEIVQVVNPATGWIQNGNSTPFLSAGSSSPAPGSYPLYMAYDPQTFRAKELMRLLSAPGKLSLDGLQEVANSRHLTMMKAWMPQLVMAFDRAAAAQPALKEELGVLVDTLRRWDHHTSPGSRATTLGIAWAVQYMDWIRGEGEGRPRPPAALLSRYLQNDTLFVPDTVAVRLLRRTVGQLQARYGAALVPWGEVNRLQRIHTSGSQERFSDERPSLPVAFAPGTVGSLFAFYTRTDGQKKNYGVQGNTYTALVELGPRVRARSIVYFGQSADPSSPHYFDQAPLYAEGKLKEAWYYRDEVLKHARRTYHPGEEVGVR